MALVRRGAPSARAELPDVVTLGAAGAPAEVLLRFVVPLEKGASIVRASVLLARSNTLSIDPLPVAIHAERVIGPWSSATVSWATAPPIRDLRLPRTLIAPAGPTLVRVDVTDLVRRWLTHDPSDQGLAIVAENETHTGVAFVSAGAAPGPEEATSAQQTSAAPPRLEIYFR
jgi:hypothetical protein